MNKLLGQYNLNVPMQTKVPTLQVIYVYDDRIELEYWTGEIFKKEDKNQYSILVKNKKCHKKYVFEDLLLMNETINTIVGRRSEERL